MNERVIEPPATLHCRVVANHMVLLGFHTLHQVANIILQASSGVNFFSGFHVCARVYGIRVPDLLIVLIDCQGSDLVGILD